MNSENSHLSRISIKGFKSIRELDLEMKPLNILVGANGAGKTNFISLFTFLRNLAEGRVQAYVEKQGYANAFFYYGSSVTKYIEIDVRVGINGYYVQFEHSAHDDALVFNNEFCTINTSPKKFYIRGNKGESGLLPGSEAGSAPVRRYTRDYLLECRAYHFHDTSSTADFKKICDFYASDYLYGNAGNLASFLYRLRSNEAAGFFESYQDIVSAIQAVAPFFHDFYLEPRGNDGEEKILLKWIHRDHEEPFSANQLSDGTARFICLAALFLQPEELKPRTIILDEPELGLHPAALEILADLIKSAAATRQVICSTQSILLANQFGPEDFIVVDQDNGASTFKRLEIEPLLHWLENYSMGEIWNKNLIGGRPEW